MRQPEIRQLITAALCYRSNVICGGIGFYLFMAQPANSLLALDPFQEHDRAVFSVHLVVVARHRNNAFLTLVIVGLGYSRVALVTHP